MSANVWSCESQEDSDEDVILPNSPLSNYIKELNLLEKDTLFENESENRSNNKNEPIQTTSNICHLCYCIADMSRKLIYFLNTVFCLLVSHVFTFRHLALKRYMDSIEVANFFIEEDQVFTKNWNSFRKMSFYQSLSFNLCAATFLYCFNFGVIRFSVSYLLGENFLEIIFDVQKAQYLVLCIFSSILLIISTVEMMQLCLTILRFRALLHNMTLLYSIIKKCIRLIQEAELISRGFTAVSVRSLAEKIELSHSLPISSSRRQYAELRKYTFSWTKNMFLEFRATTSVLIDKLSHNIDFDVANHYLAKLDINEFGLMLQYDLNSESEYQELLKITESFSISSLKTMFDLMELQVSEFLKCLYLTSSIHSENTHFNLIRICDNCPEIFVLDKKMSLLSIEANKMYKYYRCFEALCENDCDVRTQESVDQLEFVTTIHNMSLHLKSALWRLIEIEDKLNKCTRSDDWKDKSFAKEISSLLQAVKSEVSGYEDYLAKSDDFLDEILGDKTVPTNTDMCEIKKDESKTEPLIVVHKISDTEGEIEDEVFEDFISRNFTEKQEASDRNFHQGDCRKNMKLLKELKNVLIVKADEHHTREKIALAKKQKEYGLPVLDSDVEECNSLELLNNDLILTKNEGCKKKGLSSSIENTDENERIYHLNNKEDETLNMVERADDPKDCESENMKFGQQLGFLLEQKFSSPPLTSSKDSFATAIALMAANRRETLGLSSEEFGNESENNSEEDI